MEKQDNSGLVHLLGANNSWIEVELIEDERKLIAPIKEFPNFFSTHNLGYINPSKVREYFDNELGKVFSGSPELQVRINFEDEWHFSLTGNYCFLHAVEKERDNLNLILSGPVLKEDVLERKINSEYIVEDNSGRYIPITKERIKEEIKKERLQIDKGFRGDLRKAEKLAKVGGFDFSKKIKEAREYDWRTYVNNYSKPENLEGVMNTLEDWADFGFNFEDPKSEVLHEFLEVAGQLDYPNKDLRKRAVDLFGKYINSFDEDIRYKIEKIKGIVDSIKGLRKEKKEISLLTHQLEKGKPS